MYHGSFGVHIGGRLVFVSLSEFVYNHIVEGSSVEEREGERARGQEGRTEVVGGHHDTVLELDGEDGSTSNDRLPKCI